MSERTLLRICCSLLFAVAVAPAAERGWLLGSAGIFGNNGFMNDAKKAKLVVVCKGQKTVIEADQSGDYGIQLSRCDYRLIEVIDSSGHPLAINVRQARRFTVRDGHTTRFDVMVTPATQ